MRLTILGSGTLVPQGQRGAPGYAVNTPGAAEVLLFDSGSGTLGRAARAGLDWRCVNHVFYTHYHPDHTLDLVSFLFASNYAPPGPRTRPLAVYGPAGLEDFYGHLTTAWPSIVPQHYDLDLRVLDHGGSVHIDGGWRVSSMAMDHGNSGGLGYRVEHGGRVLTLSGDTQYCDNLVRLAENADLLVCECSSDEANRVEGHMTPEQVARAASESGAKRVLITHVYPPLVPTELADQCGQLLGESVQPGNDLQSYEV
jgi:ribonuclease BN (tRNA processing enzyme)